MSVTLAQAKNLSQDKLTNIVVDEFQTSPLMSMMAFDDNAKSNGTSMTYVYNRLKTLPTAATRALNTEYEAQEADTEQVAVNLKIMGGAFGIDRVLAQNEKQVVDLVEFQTQQKAQAAVALFNDLVINGDTTTDANGFEGIDKLIKGKATDVTTSVDLSTAANVKSNASEFLYSLRQLTKVLDEPTLFLMNSDLYAVFQSVADNSTQITFGRDELGNEFGRYGSATFVRMGQKAGSTNQIIPTANDGTTALYAVRLGLDGVHGISPEGSNIVKVIPPDMTGAGAVKRGEVEFVSAIAVKTTKAAGVLRGIKVAAASASGKSS